LFLVSEEGLKNIDLPASVDVSYPPRVAVMDNGLMLLGGYFGLFQSSDGGNHWESIKIPAPTLSQLRRLGEDCWASFSGHAGGKPSISRWRDGQWTNFPHVQGRITGRDRHRELYLSTLGGLQRIPQGSDHLPPLITVPFPNRANRVVVGEEDELWVAHGLETFRYRKSEFSPETLLENREERFYDGDALSLQVLGRERFRPTSHAQNYFYSSQVDGGSWSAMQPLGSQVPLGVLGIGPHRVRVRVMNEAGLVDETPAEILMEVFPLPIQMRAWFKPVVTLGVLTIACLAVLAMINWFTIRRLAGGLKEEVARRGKRLDASEREYKLLFEDSQDAICLFESSGELKACNTAANELLATGKEIDVSVDQLFTDQQDAQNLSLQLYQQGCVRGMRCMMQGKDGSQFDAILSANTLTDSDGNFIGHQIIIRDISDLVELQSRLRQTQTMEAVGRMAGGIAHDFNNFLAVVMYGADFIRLQDPDDEEIDKGVQMILDGAQRAKKLTSQIQTLSRAPSPKLGIIDLSDVLQILPDLLRAMVPESVELSIECARDVGRIQADPQQVEQVLVNLAVNAGHAMPDGGKLTVVAENLAMDGHDLAALDLALPPSANEASVVRLTVVDTGQGIDDSIREKVFEPFFTTKPHGKGTGLGLAIVYGLVQQLRGKIRFESRPGTGTKFEILLPRMDKEVTHQAEEPVLSSSRGHETILLVEDEDDIRELAGRSLRSYGYRVHEARDGETALEMLAHLNPLDLVVSDIVMNAVDGHDLVKKLRQIRPHIPVLLISGYPQQSHNGRLDDIDVPFLRKPFAPAELASTVRHLLDVAAEQRQDGKAIA